MDKNNIALNLVLNSGNMKSKYLQLKEVLQTKTILLMMGQKNILLE